MEALQKAGEELGVDQNLGGQDAHASRQVRAAFLGTPEIAVSALEAMADTCNVHAVFCNPDRPKGRGQAIAMPPVKCAALDLGLDVYQPANWKDGTAKAIWGQLKIDLAVVVAYGHILPAWMLDSCPLGAWNLHFSLLPRWRGASPVHHTIAAGDEETGVTLMKIVPGLDEGPILAQTRMRLTGQETSDQLFSALAKDAADLLRANLPSMMDGSAAAVPQDDSSATYAPKLKKELAKLDLSKDPIELHRQMRAQQPWPGAEILVEGSIIKILAVGDIAPSDSPPGTLRWGKGGAWLTVGGNGAIELLVLKREGKPPMPSNQALQHFGKCGPLALIP